MKKILFISFLTLFTAQNTTSQNLNELLKKASKIQNIEQVKVGSFLLSLSKMFASTSNLPSISNTIKNIEVIDFSSCNTKDKNEITNDIKNIQSNLNQEVLIQVKDKGDFVKIMAQKNKGVISEITILVANDKSPSIIRLIGKITQQDIDQLIQEYKQA